MIFFFIVKVYNIVDKLKLLTIIAKNVIQALCSQSLRQMIKKAYSNSYSKLKKVPKNLIA